MLQRVCNHAALLVLGIFVGMVVSVGWYGLGQGGQVQATATHGEANFAIATGFVDPELEAFYFLDFLTGDLRAAVISRRTAAFRRLLRKKYLGGFRARYLRIPSFSWSRAWRIFRADGFPYKLVLV